jgi:putative glycerol-1-phosphate prenyltransferase
MSSVLKHLQTKKLNHLKGIAVLIDPDQFGQKTKEIYEIAQSNGVDIFLVGGSLVSAGVTQDCIHELKSYGAQNVVLFPGHEMQLSPNADALLFMSLISGRNPDFLIGKHVSAAPWIKKNKIEPIPTGYMLIESGKLTSAVYMSGTTPIPSDKPDIAAATAMAGEMLGMQLMYLDAGSGAQNTVPQQLISAVHHSVDAVIFVGGGIKNTLDAENAWNNGADYIVVGNGIFNNPLLLEDLCNAMISINSQKIHI